MKYISTRGQGTSLSFSDILFEGYAADGGLYVPAQFPKVDAHTLQTWRGLSYASLAFEVIRLFAEEIDKTELWRICGETYQPNNFVHTRHLFDNDEVVTLKWLHDHVGLLELSNGPSWPLTTSRCSSWLVSLMRSSLLVVLAPFWAPRRGTWAPRLKLLLVATRISASSCCRRRIA